MKFLHIGNICGIPNSIRDAQIELGHTSKTLSFYPEPYHPSDFNYDATYSLGNFSSIAKRMWILFKRDLAINFLSNIINNVTLPYLKMVIHFKKSFCCPSFLAKYQFFTV